MLLAFTGGAGILLLDRLGENFPFTSVNPVFIDPELTGPDRLCNVFGSVIGDFFGGGDPAKDVYSWEILGPAGQSLFKGTGGAGFQTISYTFSLIGTHKVSLKVSRGGILIGDFLKDVELIKGPVMLLKSSYEICNSQELEVKAIDPSSQNFSNYTFIWKDDAGNEIGNANSLKISKPGKYSVNFFFTSSSGIPECSTTLETTVSLLETFNLIPASSTICTGQTLFYQTDPPTVGDWFLQKNGSSNLISLGSGSEKIISSDNLIEGFGQYEVIVKTTNPNNPTCAPEATSDLFFNIEPQVEVISSSGASDCLASDGKLEIQALTDLQFISVKGESISLGPFKAGDVFQIPNLESGAYTLEIFLNGCANSIGTVVPLEIPPLGLEYDISNVQGESCTPTGKINGSFEVTLKNGPIEGSYKVINEKGIQVVKDALPATDNFQISLSSGKYFFEILDKDSCNLPKREEIEIPGKSQTVFFTPSQLNICQTLEFTPQTTQALVFTLAYPDGSTQTKPAGDSFTLNQAGEHTIVGVLPNQSDICPAESKFNVTLVDPVDYEPKLINQDCFGNRTYQADIKGRDPATVKFSWFNEKDQLVGTGQFLNPVSYGTFKLDVQPLNSEACPIPPVEFEIKEPVLFVDVTLNATKLCEYGPRAVIALSTTFPEEVTDIEWRRYDASGNIENLPQFKDSTQITIDKEGTYEAAVFSRIPSINKNCELGRSTIQVDLIPNKVTFDIPGNLSICDPYQLIPQSTSPLEFSLIYPDGNVETKSWNEAFTIDQAGPYTILGYDPDIKGPLCPEQKTFEVTINSPVQYQPVLNNLSCEGIYEYQAQVDNYAPDQVDYFWRDPAGNLVGSSAVFTTSTYGTFTLEVQPKGSIPCKIDPQSFEVATPVLQVATKIIAGPLCPDQPNAALEVDADFTEISTIEWWFTDINNNRIQLISETNKKEILASREGTYEGIVRNSFNCILGRDQVLVLRSSDQVRPALEVSYQVCPRYEIAPTLNPGNFAQYEWYFEDALVGNSPTFKPLQIGTYKVIVYSTEGCAYETTFITEEECELKAIFPNAIQPGNPEKPFLIYTNYLIDELEVWIFNRWGEVIFHCKNTDLLTEESTCLWDGYFDGQKIPPGSYAYRLNFKNLEKNISKEQLGSILVID